MEKCSRDSMLVRAEDSWSKSLNPGRSRRRIFFSTVNSVCWLLFCVHSTPVFLQWHVKDPSHSAKSAGGRLHLNTHTPLTQQSGLTMLLSMHSVGTYQEMSSHRTLQGTLSQSSQLTESLWTDPGLKSGISVRKLISTFKKKAQAGNELSTILPKSLHTRKKPPPPKASTICNQGCRCFMLSRGPANWVVSCQKKIWFLSQHSSTSSSEVRVCMASELELMDFVACGHCVSYFGFWLWLVCQQKKIFRQRPCTQHDPCTMPLSFLRISQE